MHVPLSAPIDTASRNFVFGRLESGDEAIVPSLKDKRVVEGDGNQSGGDGDDGDGDDTESGGSIDSQRVEGARLSTESQYTHQSRRMQDGDSPVSSRPPIRPAERPYGGVRHQCRRRRIKIEPIKVSQLETAEMTYLGCTGIAQPPPNDPKRCLKVIGPCR